MTFDQLASVATQVVENIQRRLPPVIAQAAIAVPVFYESRPNADMVAEGLEPDILGLFVGQEHLGNPGESQPLPPQIFLFVENIRDLADGSEVIFRDEVRLTYLHELGHYLGWDEGEIARRGLE